MSFQLSLKTYPASKRSEKSLIHEGRNQSEIEYDDWHLPGQKEQKSDWLLSSLIIISHTYPDKKIYSII